MSDAKMLRVGQKIAFLSETGTIIARVEAGQSINDVWTNLLDKDPNLYDARAGEPPMTPVSSVRYIVLIEKPQGLYVRWPYTYHVKGLVDGSEEESKVEAKAKKG